MDAKDVDLKTSLGRRRWEAGSKCCEEYQILELGDEARKTERVKRRCQCQRGIRLTISK